MTAVPQRASRSIAAAVLTAGAIGVALDLGRVDSPARRPLVLLFLVAAPALAGAGLMRGADRFARLIIGGATATVINALVAIVMLAAGVWSARGGLLAVAVISAVGLAVRLPPVGTRVARRRSSRGGGRREPSASPTSEIADATASPSGTIRQHQSAAASPAPAADEATLQMSAIQMPARQETPGDDPAIAQFLATAPDPAVAADRAGPGRQSVGGGAPASGGVTLVPSASRQDQSPHEDDATVQFPRPSRGE